MSIFEYFLILLGLYVLIPPIYNLLKIVKMTLFLSKLNLKQRYYDKETYALVTGCTEGIGKAMIYELAKEGFNIVLLSRNPKKLGAVNHDLTERFPNIKTRVIIADFSDGNNLELFERIAKEVADIDIGILINNAGINHRG